MSELHEHSAGNYIWNSVGATLNASQSVVMLMIITRTLGLAAAGVYSIAFATGSLFVLIGNYGVRNYQISDLEERYSYRVYAAHRAVTVCIMLAVSLDYCIYSNIHGDYSNTKTWTIFAMCVLKAIDAIEDLFGGRLQQRGRLDCSGKLQTVRLLASMTSMATAMIITRNLMVAVWIAVLVAGFTDVVVIFHYRNIITWRGGCVAYTSVRGLMVECMPVCAANFLSFYLINAPKFAIDAELNESAQAEYNFIAMPVFVIQLMGSFIYQPLLVDMAEDWNRHNVARFVDRFRWLIYALVMITGITLVGAWFLGTPILSILYTTDLCSYRLELMILLVGGGLLAYSGLLSAILTITRDQNKIPIVYLIAVVISIFITRYMTGQWGIRGAACSYTIIILGVSIVLTVIFISVLYRRKNYVKDSNMPQSDGT